MVDTRSKASKQRDKSKRAIEDDPLRGHGASPTQSTRENSVDYPSTQQFVTPEQLWEALKQVQEAMTHGMCEEMKATEHQVKPNRGFEYKPTPGYTAPYWQA